MPYIHDSDPHRTEAMAGTEKVKWEYNMRRDMQQILPKLFLGPYGVATRRQFDYLVQAGITHIVCIRHTLEAMNVKPNFPDHFSYLVLDIADHPLENIIAHLPRFNEFVHSALQGGGRVLVHSNAGISRSAALTIGYIMEYCNVDFEQAYHLVQARRFCICPNEGFTAQLMEYNSIWRARRQAGVNGNELLPTQDHNGTSLRKRTTGDDQDVDTRPTQPAYALSQSVNVTDSMET